MKIGKAAAIIEKSVRQTDQLKISLLLMASM